MISLKKKINQNKRRTVLKSKRSVTPNTFDAALSLSKMMDIDDFEILNEDTDTPLTDSSLDSNPEIDLNYDLLNDMLEEYYDE